MAIDFPINPSNGQLYIANTKSWFYTGKGWKGYMPSGTIETVMTNSVSTPTVNANQTVFTTPTYNIGQNNLKVFLNGVRQNNITDYIETTTTSITLTTGTGVNDIIVFEVPGYVDRPTTANSLTIINDISTNAIRYPLYATSTSGILTAGYTTDTKYTFNPSTGTLNITNISANGDIIAGLADGNTLGGATNPIIASIGNVNNYVQSYIINYSNTAQSSADFVAYTNNGTDSSGWIDMGITSNAFSQAAYSVTGRNEGYVFMSAPAGSGTSGNLVIATDSTGLYNSIQLYTNGFSNETNLRATFDNLGYFTGNVNGLSPGVYPAQQYYRLNSTVVGLNATGAQKALGVGVTLVGNTVYEFEYVYALSKSAGVTSHTISLLFGGTATLNNIGYFITRIGSGTTFVDTTVTSLSYYIQTAAATAITSAITTAGRYDIGLVKGTVSIAAGGTFIPQYALSAAPGGAYTTAIGSYMKIWPVAAAGSNVNVGSWA